MHSLSSGVRERVLVSNSNTSSMQLHRWCFCFSWAKAHSIVKNLWVRCTLNQIKEKFEKLFSINTQCARVYICWKRSLFRRQRRDLQWTLYNTRVILLHHYVLNWNDNFPKQARSNSKEIRYFSNRYCEKYKTPDYGSFLSLVASPAHCIFALSLHRIHFNHRCKLTKDFKFICCINQTRETHVHFRRKLRRIMHSNHIIRWYPFGKKLARLHRNFSI